MTSEQISKEVDGRLKHKGLYDHRLNAIEKFLSTPKTNLKHGLGIKTDLEFIDYDRALNEGSTTIKIDGIILENHRIIDGIQVYKFSDFLHDKNIDEAYKKTVITYLSNKYGFSNLSTSKIEHLHQALSNNIIVHIPDNNTSKKHLLIERIIDANSYNEILFMIGDNSNTKIYLKTHHDDSKNNINSIVTDNVDLLIGKNSDIELIEHRNLSQRDVVFGRKKAIIDSDSKLNWINIDKDSRLSIIEQNSNISGDNSKSFMSNIVCGKSSEYYIYNISEHTGKNTNSLMQNKCVLKNSKAVIKGLVKINKEASQSNGYQKSDILMLDNESRAISVPDLEIHNHDVKCTHGSTITRLDNEKIFYLQSRGILRETAEKLIIEGFYDKLLNTITDEHLRESIRNEILE